LTPLVIITACSGDSQEFTAANRPLTPDAPEFTPKALPTSEQPVTGDWIYRNIRSEPETLNPIIATDFGEHIVNYGLSGQVHESLLYMDPRTFQWRPLLAQSWEESEDHLVFTFHLRKGVRWHNGQPFTAEDVIYTMDRLLDLKVRSEHKRYAFKDLDTYEALDDYTVRFTMKKPYFLSIDALGQAQTFTIVSKSVFDDGQDINSHSAGRAPVGTGPYKFKRWKTGREIVLERNEEYWGESIGRQGYLDRIIFRVVPDMSAAVQMVKAGEIDFLVDIREDQWVKQLNSASFSASFNKHQFYTPQYSYIGWNMKRPFFSDKRVRRAMTQLTNRQEFLDQVMHGLGWVVSGDAFFDGPNYDPNILPLPFDPQEAKRLLDEAGWVDSDGDGIRDKDGVKFEFMFLIPNTSKQGEQIAVLLKEETDKVGITMTIQKIEWALFVQRLLEKNFDVVLLRWISEWRSDPYQVWHSESAGPNGSNHVSFINEQADRIIEELRGTYDEQKRIELFHRFHRILHEEQAYTFLHTRAELIAVNKRIHGVQTFSLVPGYDLLEWWVPKEEQKYN